MVLILTAGERLNTLTRLAWFALVGVCERELRDEPLLEAFRPVVLRAGCCTPERTLELPKAGDLDITTVDIPERRVDVGRLIRVITVSRDLRAIYAGFA